MLVRRRVGVDLASLAGLCLAKKDRHGVVEERPMDYELEMIMMNFDRTSAVRYRRLLDQASDTIDSHGMAHR